MTGPHAVVVRAPAKINLSLRILGRRPDGYHELRTIFQALELHDILACVPSRGPFRLRCQSRDVPSDRSNLVWQAADALWRFAGHRLPPKGVTVVLQKQIPVGGGLGGGSSDAAAALRALTRLWKIRVAKSALHEIAASLGADVPFFLVGGTALGRGSGNEISRLVDRPRRWVVLLVPSFRVSTVDAYAWHTGEQEPTAGRRRATEAVNDLEAAVARRRPEILEMTRALDRAGAVRAFMSGSGSTVVGLFRSRQRAEAAAKVLRRSRWTPIVTRTLGRRRYERFVAPRARSLAGRHGHLLD